MKKTYVVRLGRNGICFTQITIQAESEYNAIQQALKSYLGLQVISIKEK